MRYTREQMLERLRAQTAQGKPIVGAGAGTGISAKFAEAGGADLIIIYNSGRYRMAGHGSLSGLLSFGDANQIVYEMGEREVLPIVKEGPGHRRRQRHRPSAANAALPPAARRLGLLRHQQLPDRRPD